jgi:PleD family two-component response regulator
LAQRKLVRNSTPTDESWTIHSKQIASRGWPELIRLRWIPSPGSAAKGKPRILIVDDDSNSTHLVKILLERSGPISYWRKTMPPKADQTAHNFKPDVILLDIVMPKIDEGELARQIEADRELHDTPIIS